MNIEPTRPEVAFLPARMFIGGTRADRRVRLAAHRKKSGAYPRSRGVRKKRNRIQIACAVENPLPTFKAIVGGN
jgi:hypothetical protein